MDIELTIGGSAEPNRSDRPGPLNRRNERNPKMKYEILSHIDDMLIAGVNHEMLACKNHGWVTKESLCEAIPVEYRLVGKGDTFRFDLFKFRL